MAKFDYRKENMSELKHVQIYTDGACLGNPGPGGYGVVLIYESRRKELSGGFRMTTNSRMELMAAIDGLKAVQEKCRVTVYSNSKYVVDAMVEGWAERWRDDDWMRNKKEKALNPDLWRRLLNKTNGHEVEFVWLAGHDGNPENARCDQLAKAAATARHLKIDFGYKPVLEEAKKKLGRRNSYGVFVRPVGRPIM